MPQKKQARPHNARSHSSLGAFAQTASCKLREKHMKGTRHQLRQQSRKEGLNPWRKSGVSEGYCAGEDLREDFITGGGGAPLGKEKRHSHGWRNLRRREQQRPLVGPRRKRGPGRTRCRERTRPQVEVARENIWAPIEVKKAAGGR